MMHVVPGSFIPKPSDDEIARVQAWQDVQRRQNVDEMAQRWMRDGFRFHGVPLSHLSPAALIGLVIHLMDARSGLITPGFESCPP